MKIEIVHLFERPEHRPLIAGWIHDEWWTEVPGASAEKMEARLAQADSPDKVPLSLLALADGEPAGTVNLVENDNENRPDLRPWLAAMLVRPDLRGQGIGSALVRELAACAARLGEAELYLGTDDPGFYERLGAEIYDNPGKAYRIMRMDLSGLR